MIIAKTGSYDSPFEVVGGAETFGGFVFLSIAFLKDKYSVRESIEDRPALKRRRYVSESFT